MIPFKEDERNRCPAPDCSNPQNAVVKNKDGIWGDGDVVCGTCGTYIRMWDSG